MHDLLYILITLASFVVLALLAGWLDRFLSDNDEPDEVTEPAPAHEVLPR